MPTDTDECAPIGTVLPDPLHWKSRAAFIGVPLKSYKPLHCTAATEGQVLSSAQQSTTVDPTYDLSRAVGAGVAGGRAITSSPPPQIMEGIKAENFSSKRPRITHYPSDFQTFLRPCLYTIYVQREFIPSEIIQREFSPHPKISFKIP